MLETYLEAYQTKYVQSGNVRLQERGASREVDLASNSMLDFMDNLTKRIVTLKHYNVIGTDVLWVTAKNCSRPLSQDYYVKMVSQLR